MRTVLAFCVFSCAASAVLAQTNFVPLSNLHQSYYGVIELFNTQALGIPFTTGSTKTGLISVSVPVAFGPVQDGPDTFGVFIFSDSGGLPGSNLASLSGNSFPTNTGTYTYTNTSGLVLSENTTYWIIASSLGPDEGGEDGYYLPSVTNSAVDTGSIWKMGTGAGGCIGCSWSTIPNAYFQFSLTVTPIGSPTISISQPIVLTYPTPEFPFVLQQNTNLAATTNWTVVTNAILSGVISNQTVYILPPSAQSLFYRLILQ